MSLQTFHKSISFLKQGFEPLNIKNIDIIFHGGEPLLIEKQQFQCMCDILKKELSPCKYRILLQTNGVLIDADWITLFKENNIDLGISLDGPQEYHDQNRKYKNGTGSYTTIKENLNLLQTYGLIPGILCVANPEHDAKLIFKHFVHDLKLTSFDFLFPNELYSNSRKNKSMVKFYCDLFDAWVTLDNPNIHIRFLKATLLLLLGQESIMQDFGPDNTSLLPCITIFPNGDITPSDELCTTGEHAIIYTGLNINHSKLSEVFNNNVFLIIKNSKLALPLKCQSCCWKKICCGGMSLHRYNENNKFDNPSIFCDDFREIFAHVSWYMLQNGMTKDKLKKTICLENCD